MSLALPDNIDDTLALLSRENYVADRSLATTLFLALKMGRPLFLEGEAGVGKTAVVEGLALRVAVGDVPPPLQGVEEARHSNVVELGHAAAVRLHGGEEEAEPAGARLAVDDALERHDQGAVREPAVVEELHRAPDGGALRLVRDRVLAALVECRLADDAHHLVARAARLV